MEHFWIIFTACLVAIPSAITGTFLVLRKSSMLGDAIAHAVLPGIVIAFMISGSRAGLPLLVGAALSGVLVTLLIEWIQKKLRLQHDASIGMSYTFMFALGIILVSQYGAQADLDQECILYGEIAFVPLDVWTFSGISLGPRQVWILGALTLITCIVLIRTYRALLLTSFDPVFAASTGVQLGVWHYGLMSFTALDTVFSFEAVGAILVIAFLVGPAATAYLLHKQLISLIFGAMGWGISASVLGYVLSYWLNASIAGSMATVIGLQFAAVMIWIKIKGLRKQQDAYAPSSIST